MFFVTAKKRRHEATTGDQNSFFWPRASVFLRFLLLCSTRSPHGPIPTPKRIQEGTADRRFESRGLTLAGDRVIGKSDSVGKIGAGGIAGTRGLEVVDGAGSFAVSQARGRRWSS